MTAPAIGAQLAERLYLAKAAPWDIGEAQPVIRHLVALGAVTGDVLDPGCGTGHHSVLYARHGCSVVGVDLAPTAITRAKRNARKAGVPVHFEVADATRLDYRHRFDTVVDAKLFDNLEDAADRRRYAVALRRATRPGGRLFMFAFGPGDVNGVHNHLLAKDSPRRVPFGGRLADHLRGLDDLAVGQRRLRTDMPPVPEAHPGWPNAHSGGRDPCGARGEQPCNGVMFAALPVRNYQATALPRRRRWCRGAGTKCC